MFSVSGDVVQLEFAVDSYYPGNYFEGAMLTEVVTLPNGIDGEHN